MTEVLGNSLYISGFALQGKLPVEKAELILRQLVELIGMSTGEMEPKVWIYPLPVGQGGVGETICQPLLESFLISDSWPELDKVYIVLASCRFFSHDTVEDYLSKAIGPVLRRGKMWL